MARRLAALGVVMAVGLLGASALPPATSAEAGYYSEPGYYASATMSSGSQQLRVQVSTARIHSNPYQPLAPATYVSHGCFVVGIAAAYCGQMQLDVDPLMRTARIRGTHPGDAYYRDFFADVTITTDSTYEVTVGQVYQRSIGASHGSRIDSEGTSAGVISMANLRLEGPGTGKIRLEANAELWARP